MANENKVRRRVLKGTVKSSKMNKTVVVEVSHRIMHKTYKKFVTRKVRYKVHDETDQCSVGDQVEIIECRPLSKEKRWRLKDLVERSV